MQHAIAPGGSWGIDIQNGQPNQVRVTVVGNGQTTIHYGNPPGPAQPPVLTTANTPQFINIPANVNLVTIVNNSNDDVHIGW